MAKEWYFQLMGAEIGPISSSELKRKAQLGQIQPETLVRAAPDGKWQPADRVKGLIDPPPSVVSAPKAADTVTISAPSPAVAIKPTTDDRVYHFTGDTATDITPPAEPASGEYDFFQMVGFELAIGKPLHDVLLERCRLQHLTMTEVTRRALAEYLGRKDLIEPPAAAEPVGLG